MPMVVKKTSALAPGNATLPAQTGAPTPQSLTGSLPSASLPGPGGQAAPQNQQAKPQPLQQGGAVPGPMSFIKTGVAAKTALQEEEARAEMNAADRNRPYEWYIGKDDYHKDFQITFLDGALDAQGEIQITAWAEHTRQVAGNWKKIVCLQPGYCPCCATDDKPAATVCAFTIVDHTPYTIKQGKRQGEVIVNQRKLYKAHRGTLAILQKFATQYGGLRGICFNVSRSNERAPRVGDVLVPTSKYADEDLQKLMGRDDKQQRLDLPFNYAEAAPYYTLEELQAMGIGSASNVIGNESKQDLSSQL